MCRLRKGVVNASSICQDVSPGDRRTVNGILRCVLASICTCTLYMHVDKHDMVFAGVCIVVSVHVFVVAQARTAHDISGESDRTQACKSAKPEVGRWFVGVSAGHAPRLPVALWIIQHVLF